MRTIIIESFKQYIEYTEKYKNNYLFRGQANKNWSIIPSLFRDNSVLEQEVNTIKESEYFDNENILTGIFKMQHYGVPTRLLDLTISPLSALFFTIDDETQLNNDGVVYVIDKNKSIPFNESEIVRFSRLIIDETLSDRQLAEDEIACLTRDYIIQYDYRFSYSNNRAILQGGTALVVGFGFEENTICRDKQINLEPYLIEKIIIPFRLKSIIKDELSILGYSKSTLYESFETTQPDKVQLSKFEFDITQRAGFYKITAKYKVNTINFNNDDLTLEIVSLYSTLFAKYGANSRIWLFFFFDENDLEHFNWICRGQWDEQDNYKLIWTKDYIKQRLKYINEEISTQEVITRFKPFINQATIIEDKIRQVICSKTYDDIVDILFHMEKEVTKCFLQSNDIPYGDYAIEAFARTALNYICEVDRLVRDNIIFIKRGEKQQFIMYWIDSVLKDCQKARNKLEKYREYYN